MDATNGVLFQITYLILKKGNKTNLYRRIEKATDMTVIIVLLSSLKK